MAKKVLPTVLALILLLSACGSRLPSPPGPPAPPARGTGPMQGEDISRKSG